MRVSWMERTPTRVGGSETVHKNKKPSLPTNRRMKAINESFPALAEKAGLILLFDGEVGPTGDHDEHNQADILTSGFEPRSRLPGRSCMHGAGQWLNGSL